MTIDRDDLSALTTMLSEGTRRATARGALESLELTLESLIEVAVANVPGADYAGVTMNESGKLTTRAPSDPRVARLDDLQAELGEGPCVSALTKGTSRIVEVVDFTEDERWPKFARLAIEQGVYSLLSFAMAPDGEVPGAVNLYSTRRSGFGPSEQALGEAFAMHMGVLVYGARAVENLRRAVGTRDVIGQAKGILMERFDISSDEAFSLLTRSSQETNIKLRDVAEWLISERGKRVDDDPTGDLPRR